MNYVVAFDLPGEGSDESMYNWDIFLPPKFSGHFVSSLPKTWIPAWGFRKSGPTSHSLPVYVKNRNSFVALFWYTGRSLCSPRKVNNPVRLFCQIAAFPLLSTMIWEHEHCRVETNASACGLAIWWSRSHFLSHMKHLLLPKSQTLQGGFLHL